MILFMKIDKIKALQILDSRGQPTLKVYVVLDDLSIHSASVPSGASTGSHEAIELRDKDPALFHGLSVFKAIDNVENLIAPNLIGRDIEELSENESLLLNLDRSGNKSLLGANSILGVNMALVKAMAFSTKKPLWQFLNEFYFKDINLQPKFPRLMVNVVNGGKHAGWNFDIQEFMIMPKVDEPYHAIKISAEIFYSLKKLLEKNKLSTLVGDEGGFSPKLDSNEQVFELILEAAKNAGYENLKDYNFGVDCAATEFFREGNYELKKTGEIKSYKELMKYYIEMENKFKIASFEDPFAEDDWEAFEEFTKKSHENGFEVVGDDLFVTNTDRIKTGIEKRAASAVLIKLNQIGSVFETVSAIKLAKKAGLKVVVSHRSGETEDSFISDLAYASASDFIKAGSMSRSDRLSKYNRLLEIQKNIL